MTVDKRFDASRHLVTLKGREYLEVKWRLLWLRTEHPEASIETELIRLDEGYAVFKARVSIPAGGSATGWGSETASDFPDFLEKAETKALGRALAALGYGTQFTEDFEFQKDGEQALVDSPVERPQRRQPAEDRRLGEWARDQGISSLDEPAGQALARWLDTQWRVSPQEFRAGDAGTVPRSMRDRIIARLETLGLQGVQRELAEASGRHA